MKRKALIAASIGVMALTLVGTVAFGGEHTLIRHEAADSYSLTVTPDDVNVLSSTKSTVETSYGSLITFGHTNIGIAGGNFTLAEGTLFNYDDLEANPNGGALSGLTSITVDIVEGSLTLSYGWETDVWSEDTIALTDNVACDLSDLHPNYFKLSGSATFSTISVLYTCTRGEEPVGTNSLYLNVGTWWAGNAWYCIHAWDSNDNYADLAPSKYLGNKTYLFEIPENLTKCDILRKNPSNKNVGYDSVWNRASNVTITDGNVITITDWNEKFTSTAYTPVAPVYSVAGSMNGWNSTGYELTDNGDNTYTISNLTVEAGAEFKIQENHSWDICYGAGGNTDGGTGNYTIAAAGTYSITLSWTEANCIPQITVA